MKRAFLTVAVTVLVWAMASPASAQLIVRGGNSVDGYVLNGCELYPDPDGGRGLGVDCTNAEAPARLRYRYLTVSPGPADFPRTVPDLSVEFEWMGDIRTGRVTVPVGVDVVIEEVVWHRD